MKKPFGMLGRALVFLAAVSLFACFSITVNVYFPAKDVKSAFKSLEEDLMKGEEAPPAEPAPDDKAAPGPQGSLLDLIGPRAAYAQDSGELSKELAERLRDDPDVVAAYREMGSRLGFIDRLRDTGMVGEGNDGMLAARQDLGKKESVAVDKENENRRTIIRSMAKAIVAINNQPVTDDNVNQVLDKAASEFAAVRRDAAKPGWWVQKPGGEWAKK